MFKHKSHLIFLMLIFFLTLPIIHAGEPSSEPILRIETGMHTAPIRRIGVDAAEQFLLTASNDKTLRLWDLHTGDLLKTYRVPIGTGNEGRLDSGAISPDGEWVAGAGWTGAEWDDNTVSIYLFNRASGKLMKRLSGLEEVISHLCVSKDGQYLGASLAEYGVRVWDTQTWQQIFSDTDYADRSEWCDFDSQNRLVTSSFDGYLRLYSAASDSFSLVAKRKTPGGSQPFAAVFSPIGDKIAVGFHDSTNINVLDGHDLAFLYAPDTTGIDNGNLFSVAWSQDGNSLYAGGLYDDGSNWPVLHWSQAEQGNYTKWQASLNTIMDIRSLKNDRIVYGAGDPAFAVLDNAGNKIVEQEASIADYREVLFDGDFGISHDGNSIHFEYDNLRPARFSLSEQSLILNPQPDTNLTPPDTTSLDITNWLDEYEPKLNGKALSLVPYERSRSLAIVPDKSKFLLGTEWSLYLFDTNAQQIWRADVPSVTWGVNISGDGKKAVAAFADGTIRWYNLDNGKELLAFFPHKDGKRWIAWTPSGYYMSSADNTDNLIGWHVNEGKDKTSSFFPVGALFAKYKRSDIVKKILETMDENEAIRLANLEKEGSIKPPINVGKALTEVSDKYKVNLEPSGLGQAIIIGASGAQDSNSLFPYTLEFTTEMYRFLHRKGFSDGDVIFMNPRLPIVPINNYPDDARQDFSMREPKKELQQAIAIAKQELQPGEQFVFYLHGHARADSVRISKTSEISAQELKALLAQIPTTVEQIIILDTCYSGSFLDELAGVPNRIVVTSADANSLSWSSDSMSFAESFIRYLKYGNSVGETFELAKRSIINEPDFFGVQSPQLDDTQDGFYTNDDGLFANSIYIGGKKVHGSLPPEITEIHPSIKLAEGQTTATLWVKAIPDFNGMKKVRAILVNEQDSVTEYQGESTNFTRRELTLLPNYDLQRYQIDYDQFHTARNWKILYQAQSMEGDWSDIKMGHVVYEGAVISPTIAAHTNKALYSVGDNLQLDVTLTGETMVDLYVGVIFPAGYYQTISPPMNFSMVNVLQPYETNVKLAGEQTFHVLNVDLPAIAVGDYQACGLITKVDSDPLNNDNWIQLDCKGLQFQ
ncbi:WD-40 repeat protein [Beggiatoa sp. PS]|nr:WD-40 repeat protein [Beggiatoa sp. PS]